MQNPSRQTYISHVNTTQHQHINTHTSMNQTQQLRDLLSFLIRHAKLHGLPEIKISVARARTMLADLESEPAKPAPEKTPAFYKKLDRAFNINR